MHLLRLELCRAFIGDEPAEAAIVQNQALQRDVYATLKALVVDYHDSAVQKLTQQESHLLPAALLKCRLARSET